MTFLRAPLRSKSTFSSFFSMRLLFEAILVCIGCAPDVYPDQLITRTLNARDGLADEPIPATCSRIRKRTV
jgi:hypothetical protein